MPPHQSLRHDEHSEESTSSVLSEKSSSVHKRRVHFSISPVGIHNIPHVDDMSDQDIAAIWYDRSDYEDIRQKLIPIIKKMMRGDRIDENDKMTKRGLEYRTRDGAIRRQHNKQEGFLAVLEEQDRQRMIGSKDEKRIADAYINVTAHCCGEARRLGQDDEAAKREILADFNIALVNGKSPSGRSRPGRMNSLLKQVFIRRTALADERPLPEKTRVAGQAA